jgi:signal-transduction protein with cAMP-binding, CBS, and nucleotidyltransferase domain
LARKAVNNPDLESAVVAEEGEVLGLVMRRVLDYAVASQGAESDAAVLTLADPHAMRVDAEAPVEEVARRAALRRVEQVHDDVIVLREGRYAGVVPVRLLLEALLESPGPSERRAA